MQFRQNEVETEFLDVIQGNREYGNDSFKEVVKAFLDLVIIQKISEIIKQYDEGRNIAKTAKDFKESCSHVNAMKAMEDVDMLIKDREYINWFIENCVVLFNKCSKLVGR